GKGTAPAGFSEALHAVTHELAYAMVRDGEGATKTLELTVSGAANTKQARTVARAVVNSNLVKTALHGEDPNWGRIVSAAGAVGAGIDPHGRALYVKKKIWGGAG